MKNNRSYSNDKSDQPSSDVSHPKDKAPLLNPDGQNEYRDERNEGTPDAEEQEITPKQPLYQDKTEAYYLKKKQKKQS